MKFRQCLFLPLFFLAFAAQSQNTEMGVYLKAGGYLRALQLDTTAAEKLAVTLPGGSHALVDLTAVHFVKPLRSNRHYFADGTNIKKRGFYTSLSLGYMIAERGGAWNSDNRTGFGLYATRSYRWSPAFSAGLGIGYEAHEYGFIPLQLDFSGLISRALSGKPTRRAYAVPLSWRVQAGYNLPGRNLVAGGDENERLRGSWLLHPSVGLVFPARRGPVVELDFGYRIQRYFRTWSWEWSTYSYEDRIILKSLTLRLWIFI
ncbi:MAG: hypothetical protein CMN32_10545 [Saprospirales bacterium]|nr:hypothetical protein [Saprospirales bacterium]